MNYDVTRPKPLLLWGRTRTRVFSCPFLTAEARVRSQNSRCGICGGLCDTQTGISRNISTSFLSQRPLPENTQHSQETGFHASGEIRTCNSSKWAAADLSFRLRGHWFRPNGLLATYCIQDMPSRHFTAVYSK